MCFEKIKDIIFRPYRLAHCLIYSVQLICVYVIDGQFSPTMQCKEETTQLDHLKKYILRMCVPLKSHFSFSFKT